MFDALRSRLAARPRPAGHRRRPALEALERRPPSPP